MSRESPKVTESFVIVRGSENIKKGELANGSLLKFCKFTLKKP